MDKVKLSIDKFEILKAMNLIVKNMNNQDAYEEWIYTIPDQANDDDLMDIASDKDESVYREACHDFRRICANYLDDGLFLGSWPGATGLYGAKNDEEGNE